MLVLDERKNDVKESKKQDKVNLLDYTSIELQKDFPQKFRIKQIFQWIYQKYADDFKEMSSLPLTLREELENKYHFKPLECVKFEQSTDKSVKYLFRLNDGYFIESVLLPMKEEAFDEEGKRLHHTRYTICISSQVGCKSGCSFCLTAKGGLKRNLSAGEIVAQVLWIKKHNHIPYERRVNIVFMGMGEPLDNLKNVSKAVQILSENDGLAISPRRQTISTSGLAKQIKELGEMNLGVLLAISLHAVNDELRSELMPINKAYNIASIMQAVREFPVDARKRVMFEYLLIKGINDKLEHAKELVKLLNGIKAKVNLLLFNPHEGSPYKRPDLEDAVKFQDFLSAKGLTCTIRQSKGLDISAACGQLKERKEQELKIRSNNDENSKNKNPIKPILSSVKHTKQNAQSLKKQNLQEQNFKDQSPKKQDFKNHNLTNQNSNKVSFTNKTSKNQAPKTNSHTASHSKIEPKGKIK